MGRYPEPPTVEEARGEVLAALHALPDDAFDQALAWLYPNASRPIRFGAWHGGGVVGLQSAIARYFEAKAAAAAAQPAAAGK